MMERYHLPVGLIDLIQRSLATGIQRVLGHLGGDVGHLIQSHDGTTHKHGLRNHNRTSKDVTGIGTEGIYDVLPPLVQTFSNLGHILRHLHLGSRRQRGYQRAQCALQGTTNRSTKTTQGSLLTIVKNRYLLARKLIGTYSTHVGQVLGARRLTSILGHILFKFGNT